MDNDQALHALHKEYNAKDKEVVAAEATAPTTTPSTACARSGC